MAATTMKKKMTSLQLSPIKDLIKDSMHHSTRQGMNLSVDRLAELLTAGIVGNGEIAG